MYSSSPTVSLSSSSADTRLVSEWQTLLGPATQTLRALAGTTEEEFLQIGSRMQDFYQRFSNITSIANQLVESVSGNAAQTVIGQLRHMMADMDDYLASARTQSHDSCAILERILNLLEQVSEPLEGFQKMYKILRMLSTSTKIESSRLGEMGSGFLTLAMDVEKLSHLVNEKSSGILGHRQTLATMITENLRTVRGSEDTQKAEVNAVMAKTSRSLDEMISVNSHCSSFGELISSVSGEVSGNIGEVVSSMQMHDMTRQQVEHIIEALERLTSNLSQSADAPLDTENYRKLIVEAGDVCELQSAQLRHASSELCGAVCSIVDNLQDIANKQTLMASETLSATGVADSAGGSFVETMSSGLATVTAALATCGRTDQEMAATMKKVGQTIQEITGFVTDIEEIGSEIDLIALNSQIKAAHTGREGAALGVLAEAIKRLSVEAVTQTASVSHTLLQIKEATQHLFSESLDETAQLSSKIVIMENELGGILKALGGMNVTLLSLLSDLNQRVNTLTSDIAHMTAGIDVHERVKDMADEVMSTLDSIVEKARELQPASSEFKDNLRHMEERYTMQSERQVHEAIARKRGATVTIAAEKEKSETAGEESEFGDNVDMF